MSNSTTIDNSVSHIDNILFSMVSQDNWYWQILLVIVATFVTNLLIRRSLNKLENQVKKTNNFWDDALLHSVYLPIRLLVWLIGLTLILAILHQQHDIEIISSMFFQFRKIAFIIVMTLFLYKLVYNMHQSILLARNSNADNESTTHKKLDSASIEAISKLLRVSIIIIASLTTMQVLGYSISGILAFGGMGGVAVGFAAKDLLANFFGGLMIYLDKPFRVGDWVRSPDRNIEGVVENIGWRISRIRTFDRRPLYIPNSLFTNIIVENPSRMSHRRINETIGIRYDDWHKMTTIVSDVKNMLMHHPDIDSTQTIICNFNTFNHSSIDFMIYTFTKTTNWVVYHEVKQDILLKIFEIIDRNSAEIAFPTQTLLMGDTMPLPENSLNENSLSK